MGSKKAKTSKKPNKILPTTLINNDNLKITFSYEYLDLSNSKYSLKSLNDTRIFNQFIDDYFCKLGEYCHKDNFKKALSDKSWKKHNHIHPIDWKDPQIREIGFNSLNEDLMEQIKDDCWQLGINNSTFRMHGFFIENVFYVVWLDPLHQLYYSK